MLGLAIELYLRDGLVADFSDDADDARDETATVEVHGLDTAGTTTKATVGCSISHCISLTFLNQ